jgi:hypothetical protein
VAAHQPLERRVIDGRDEPDEALIGVGLMDGGFAGHRGLRDLMLGDRLAFPESLFYLLPSTFHLLPSALSLSFPSTP